MLINPQSIIFLKPCKYPKKQLEELDVALRQIVRSETETIKHRFQILRRITETVILSAQRACKHNHFKFLFFS